MVDRLNADRRLDEVLQVITTKLSEDLPVKSLADLASISVSRLEHLFKLTVGHSIVAYRKKARLDQAANLISKTDRSVKDIMLSVGFHDPSRFAKAFRHKYGVSPTEYRHICQQQFGNETE